MKEYGQEFGGHGENDYECNHFFDLVRGHHHGQLHKHEHSHKEPIRVSSHEGAIVATVQRTFRGTIQEVNRKVENIISDIANMVEKNGGFIGHIKAIVTERRCVHSFSLLEIGRLEKKNFDNLDALEMELVAIVFGIEMEALKCWLRRKLEQN